MVLPLEVAVVLRVGVRVVGRGGRGTGGGGVCGGGRGVAWNGRAKSTQLVKCHYGCLPENPTTFQSLLSPY